MLHTYIHTYIRTYIHALTCRQTSKQHTNKETDTDSDTDTETHTHTHVPQDSEPNTIVARLCIVGFRAEPYFAEHDLCHASGGDGDKTRSRIIEVQPDNGGLAEEYGSFRK